MFSSLVFLFILIFDKIVIDNLKNNHDLRECEQHCDDDPCDVLLVRVRLRVQDEGGEEADSDPLVNVRCETEQCWIYLT